MKIVLAVCALEGYVSIAETTGTPVGCTLMVMGEVVVSTMAAGGSSVTLSGREFEKAAVATDG